MTDPYPLTTYCSMVQLRGLPSNADVSFTEVSGQQAERTTTEVREGREIEIVAELDRGVRYHSAANNLDTLTLIEPGDRAMFPRKKD